MKVLNPTHLPLAPTLRPLHPHLAHPTRTPTAAQRRLEVGPGTSVPLGYGGMPTGVLILGAVRVASAPGPCPSVPLPALGAKLAGPYHALVPLCIPLGHLGPAQLALDLVALAPGDGFLSTTTTASMQNLGSLDFLRSFSAFCHGSSLQSGRCRVGDVEAPKSGLLDSPSAPHGGGVAGDVPGLEPRLYPEGHAICHKTHRL